MTVKHLWLLTNHFVNVLRCTYENSNGDERARAHAQIRTHTTTHTEIHLYKVYTNVCIKKYMLQMTFLERYASL